MHACLYVPALCTRRPWISPLERSHCAAQLNLPLTAMVEGFGDDPALVDTSGDPDAMTSALLPAVDSRYDVMQMTLIPWYFLLLSFLSCFFLAIFSRGMVGVVGGHMHARANFKLFSGREMTRACVGAGRSLGYARCKKGVRCVRLLFGRIRPCRRVALRRADGCFCRRYIHAGVFEEECP